MTQPQNADALRAAHERLRRDKAAEIELRSVDQLLDASGTQPSGVAVLAGVLDSALRLPDVLTIRIVLPELTDVHETEIAAFRDHCRAQADADWRAAMALRQGGLREIPRALVYSVMAATVGVASGYLAEGVDGTLVTVLLYAMAFVAVIAAWTIGWAPIEQALFDWRAPGHSASVYALMAHAHIEVIEGPREVDGAVALGG